jgi:hypothetical protein
VAEWRIPEEQELRDGQFDNQRDILKSGGQQGAQTDLPEALIGRVKMWQVVLTKSRIEKTMM